MTSRAETELLTQPNWRLVSMDEQETEPIAATWVYSLLSIYTAAIFILSTGSNAMVIYATYKNPTLRKPINYIIINLALADLLCGLVTGVFILPSNMAGYYVWNQTICIAEAYMFSIFGIVGLMSICIMAVERSIVICKPYGLHKLTKQHALCGILISWLWSILWNLPPTFFKDGMGISGVGTACTPNWHSKNKWAGTFIPLYFVFCFVIPLLLIITCYWQIIRTIKHVSKESILSRRSKRERKVFKMVFLMIFVFLAAWLPYAIYSLYVIANPHKKIIEAYGSIPSYFAKSSTIYNPLIYVWLNRQFRRSVKACFSCGESNNHPTSEMSTTSNVNQNQSFLSIKNKSTQSLNKQHTTSKV